MTEFEIASLAFYEAEAARHQIEIVQGLAASLETKFNGFTSLLFGFVLAAYFAGGKLSRNQVIVLTVLYLATISQYILTSLMAGLGIVSTTAQLANLSAESQNPISNLLVVPARYYFAAMVQMGCVLASLYFIWSVRHPKAEHN